MKSLELEKELKIGKEFDVFLETKKDEFVYKSAVFICSFLDKPFYEWHDDDNPYDNSGKIIKNGTLNKDNLTDLEEYLQFYTGEATASYCSGCGWFHTTIENDLDTYLTDLIFGVYLQMYIDENTVFLNDLIVDLDDSETMQEYLNFNDIVGDSGLDLKIHIQNYFERVDLELIQQIAAN